MLTPDYLQGAPAELEELFLRLEEDIIADICRRIAKAGYLTDSAEHQVLRLRELGAGTEYIKQKISEYSELSDEAVDRLFFDAAQTSDEFYCKAYAQANIGYTPYEYNDFFQQAVTASVNQTKGELRNFTQSMGFSYRGSNGQVRFHGAAEAYRDCLDYAYMQVMTGAVDHNTAIRNATRRLTEGGLQFVDYASGVRCHADVAARRAVLTGLSQMTGKVSEHNAAELGTDIVEVDAHAGARPDHAEWQGKWFSLSGKSKKYPSLKAVTGYGTVTGLKGANCRHDFYPVIEGISEPSYTEEELKNIDPPPFEYNGKTYTYYEATQKQRAMERSMRKTKREILAADATDDKDSFAEKSVLLRRQKEEYGRFSKAAGLSVRNERAQVGGFGHSQAGRAAWAAKGNQKPLENKISSNPKRTDTNAHAGLTSKTDSATIKSINSGSKLFTEENRIKMLQHERIISGNKYEKAIIYKPDGSIDFQKKGNSDSVSFSTKEIKSMDGKVLTHNHPNGTIPSPADINIMRRGKLAEIRACNSDGAYVIRRSGKWSSELSSLKKIDSAYNSCIDEVLLKYQKIASENGENIFKYFDRAEKEGLQLFCDKYNLEFSWEDKNENKY